MPEDTIPMRVIAEAIDHIVAHHEHAPDLATLAARAGYEPTYFQKIFKAHVGISPKRLQQYLNVRQARELLSDGAPLLAAANDAGLSGGGRLHDLFVTCEAVTPGDVRFGGRGVEIMYGFHPTPIGELLIAQTSRGVCYLGFLVGQARDVPLDKMRRHLPLATCHEAPAETQDAADRIMAIWRGGKPGGRLALDLHGTNLQLQVWQALLRIPGGETTTYGAIATVLGKPAAARAIGNAVGANPVSLLIPCHRVIRATGIIDNYAWGSPRKKMLLAIENLDAMLPMS